jgi:hypothetical protein
MKPTLHMPTTPDWRNIFALGMIWHRLRDNVNIIDRAIMSLEFHKPPPMQDEEVMTAAEYRDYWREECATTGRE